MNMSAAAVGSTVYSDARESGVINKEATNQFVPPVPETLEETGLSGSTIEQLLFKTLYFRGELIGRDLARAVGLSFSLIEDLLEQAKRVQLVQMKRSVGMGNVSGYFSLTEAGRGRAREFLEVNQYVGPAPVPMHQYEWMVRRQRRQEGWLTPDGLARAYRRMVTSPDILAQIGPAVSSGNSFLIYGQPGNGKTYLAEALGGLDTLPIYMPYAIEAQGAIIQIYDAVFHQAQQDEEETSVLAVSSSPGWDRRWFKCRRPFIVSGGELTLDMLDLAYNPNSKIYDAPLQLKANNGIYLIDDFGRQRCTPAEVLNRWIVPMERQVDYLTLRTGGKITVPFEAFLVFSTNLRPDQLGDEAFLRRIGYKMHLRNPTEREFLEIFHKFCETRQLECLPSISQWFVDTYYKGPGKRMRRCHPRDVISHALDLIHFEKLPMQLTPDVLERAFLSCFVEVGDMEA
ncbi:MAG TPA: hypothetical protein VER03_04650 [Bryobacteraceae bacterium]|nr:hypothetical protein [Bryobacteraceae bacterium]